MNRKVILLEEVIEKNMDQLFLNYDIVCAHPFRIMRNADLTIEEDEAADLLKEIEKQLKKRQWGQAIRLEVEAGIDSFKIEGRMKTALYVADVARTYRQAIDDYFESPELYESKKEYYMEEISKCTYRQYTTGFFYGPTTHETQIYDNNTYVKRYTYLGIAQKITEDGFIKMEQRNKFSVGDTVEVMKPSGENVLVQVMEMKDERGKQMDSCPHPKQEIYVKFSVMPDEMDLIRVEEAV